MALFVFYLSVPYELQACTESASDACTCCCNLDSNAGMTCCADDQAASAMPDMAAAATDCCYTIYVDSSAPFLPARNGSEPLPEVAAFVIDRLPRQLLQSGIFHPRHRSDVKARDRIWSSASC